jgi:hypothetical protein
MPMRRVLISIALILVVLACIYIASSSRPTLSNATGEAATRPIPDGQTSVTPAAAGAAKPPVTSASVPLKTGAAALSFIDDASTAYDAKSIPLIAPYLDDPDPEIRKAAIDGFLRLGERNAAPLLREAAKHRDSPKEIMALLQAAEYLELPSYTDRRKTGNTPSSKALQHPHP